MGNARLTDAHIRAAKPRASSYKLTDGRGLFLLVSPSGSRLWRYRYRIAGRENLFAIGEYPELSLQQARDARDAARMLVKSGRHPAHVRKAARDSTIAEARTTFEGVAKEWVEQSATKWSDSYRRQVAGVLQNDVLPFVGSRPVSDISSAEMLAVVRRVEKRGAPALAILVRQWCSSIFAFAIATLRAESDPTVPLRRAIIRPRVRHKAALRRDELAALLKSLASPVGDPRVSAALNLLAMTFVRPSELRLARWSEFDLDRSEWRIPAERMKMREAHIVPLSKQAVALLRSLPGRSGARDAFLFPNARDPRRPMSATTLNRRLERLGYGGRFSAHAFRSTASTMLHESGVRSELIERQLAHRERNIVRASYNHASYLPERRAMLQQWADQLDALRESKT